MSLCSCDQHQNTIVVVIFTLVYMYIHFCPRNHNNSSEFKEKKTEKMRERMEKNFLKPIGFDALMCRRKYYLQMH